MGGLAAAFVVSSLGMQSAPPRQVADVGDLEHPSGLTKAQFEARANLYESFRESDLKGVEGVPIVAGVPRDGYAFVMTPKGVAYWVAPDGSEFRVVTTTSNLLAEFDHLGSSGEKAKTRVFDFRTGTPIARMSDIVYEEASK
jgi:hypothetical protein